MKTMKTMKTVLLGASAIMLSANAFANVGIDTLKTDPVNTKEAAYSMGFDELEQLQTKSGYELGKELLNSGSSYREKHSVKLIDGSYVTVQESMNEQGELAYTGVVKVKYSYKNDVHGDDHHDNDRG